MKLHRVLAVGDLHAPFVHPKYLKFCLDLYNQWECDKVVFIGDMADNHVLSQWPTDPDGLSGGHEYYEARKTIANWHKAFPGAVVCIGNHDNRHERAATKVGMSTGFLKSYQDIWDTDTWEWGLEFTIDGVLYTHGTKAGKYAALNTALDFRCSTVIGHTHTYGGVQYHCNDFDRIFGLNVGCGIDTRAYAMAYGQKFTTKPTLGAGIVIEGKQAYFEPMLIGKGEDYKR